MIPCSCDMWIMIIDWPYVHPYLWTLIAFKTFSVRVTWESHKGNINSPYLTGVISWDFLRDSMIRLKSCTTLIQNRGQCPLWRKIMKVTSNLKFKQLDTFAVWLLRIVHFEVPHRSRTWYRQIENHLRFSTIISLVIREKLK